MNPLIDTLLTSISCLPPKLRGPLPPRCKSVHFPLGRSLGLVPGKFWGSLPPDRPPPKIISPGICTTSRFFIRSGSPPSRDAPRRNNASANSTRWSFSPPPRLHSEGPIS